MNHIKKTVCLLVLIGALLLLIGCKTQDEIPMLTGSVPEETAMLCTQTLDECFRDCIVQDGQFVFLHEDGRLFWTNTDGAPIQEAQLPLPEGAYARSLVWSGGELLVFGEEQDGLWAMTTDGTLLFTLPDTEFLQVAAGEAGDLFILTGDALLRVGKDGSILQTMEDTALESIVWYQNTLFGVTREEAHDCYALAVIDFEKETVLPITLTGVPLPSGTDYVQLIQGVDGPLYLATVEALYRCDYDAQTIEKLFTWQAQNMSAPHATAIINASTIAVCEERTNLLTEARDEEASRTILTLATLATDDSNDVLLRQCVQAYNDSQERVQIVIEDYTARGETQEQAQLALITELIVPEHTPDLLDCRLFSRTQYDGLAWQGLLVDVSALFSDQDAYVLGVVDACAVDDAVYSVVPAYSFSCFFGREDAFGSSFSQSVEELLTQNVACLPDYQPLDLLRRVCEMSLDRYIDGETGETHFEEEGFLHLLRTCNTIRQTDELPAIHYERITSAAKCSSIQAMITQFEGSPFVYLQAAPEQGFAFSPCAQIAAMSEGKHRDEAMDFLTYLLSSECQSQIADALPLRYDALQAQIDAAMQEEYDPLPERAATDLRAAVERICLRENNNAELLSIVCDEAAFYFGGQRTEAEAAALIANRVGLYLKEQQ